MSPSRPDSDFAERVIPLPKEISLSGYRSVRPSEVNVSCVPADLSAEHRVATALRLLREAGFGGDAGDASRPAATRLERRGPGAGHPSPSGHPPGQREDRLEQKGGLRIELRLAERDGLQGSAADAARRIATLPNADQAYAIVCDDPSPDRVGTLLLLGNSPIGVLYAVRTLLQLLPHREGGRELSLPCLTVVDWPDIGERGQWGGNTHDEVDWTSRWKLNVIEESVGLSVDASGVTKLALSQEHVSRAHALGVTIVPYVLHLEQVALYAGLMGRSDITSTPDPSVPLPPEYVPGLCMSSPATIRIVGDWMELIASYEHITAIEVWLSEDRAACFCPHCAGKEPFELEMRCIQEAFTRARSRKPALKLRILLTQGSYPVNDKVIAAADPDVQITYYDGGRTYDSSHAPMIYPLLEEYARSGKWLGVYPQITHCWRTVFPFSAPQLIAFRSREFADKGLSNVTGYAVPSNRHHELNVMALAEWTWNSRGRTPEEFARAYARRSGIREVEEFGRWAVAAGEAGWWLAESRMLLRFIYNYDIDVRVGEDTADHRFRHAGISYDRKTIEGALVRAGEALKLAAPMGLDPLVEESDALHAGLVALLALDDLGALLGAPHDSARLEAVLDRLDLASAVLCRSVSKWGERVNAHLPSSGSQWVRLRDTANVLFRVCDTLRAKEELKLIPDRHASRRERRLGEWSARDFHSGEPARLSYDVTELVASDADHLFACFTYGQGNYAAEIRGVTLWRVEAGGTSEPVGRSIDAPMRAGRWEKWHELKVPLPRGEMRRVARGGRLRLDVEIAPVILEGAPAVWECQGWVGLRPGWPEETRIP